MRVFKFFMLLTVMYLEISLVVLGQTISPKYKVESNETCELAAVYIEQLVLEAKKNNQLIFVISNLGKSEKYRLNSIRLNVAINKLALMGVGDEKMVIAIGKRVSTNEGEIKFYLGSELFLAIFSRKGKGICLTDGDIDPKNITNSHITVLKTTLF